MTETHYEKFVDHIMSDDDSELGKIKAERDYALFSLEREIAICAQTQAQNDALVKALKNIIAANDDFRRGMPDEWEGDPLQDLCEEARALVGGAARQSHTADVGGDHG